MKLIKTHNELDVYKMSMDAAMSIFKITKSFPVEERYSLTDQIRRSSRSVSANIAEAFRKRRYEKAFVSKLSDSEAEAAEKLRSGWNMHLNVIISLLKHKNPWKKSIITSSANW